jgi:hypothetical protein
MHRPLDGLGSRIDDERVLPFNLTKWHRLDDTHEAIERIFSLKNAPKICQRAVDVVDDLRNTVMGPIPKFTQAAGVGVRSMDMWGRKPVKIGCQVEFPAVPFERTGDATRHVSNVSVF